MNDRPTMGLTLGTLVLLVLVIILQQRLIADLQDFRGHDCQVLP